VTALDADMIALATRAADALVQAMVTDAWAALRQRCAQVLGAGDANRQRRADEQLAATRAALTSGELPRDLAASRWQGRLEALLDEHPAVAPDLIRLLMAFPPAATPATTTLLALNTTRQQARAGNRSTINQIGRDQHNTDNRKNFGGLLAVVAVIVVVMILGFAAKTVYVWIAESPGAGITEDTPCRTYLAADTESREHAVKTIGLEKGATGAGNPMARLNVDYSCGQVPDTPVGDIIARQNY
jgi:hypothetical protein